MMLDRRDSAQVDDLIVSTVTTASETVRFYVTCAIVVATLTITAVLVVAILVPDNTGVVATIIGITSPLLLALIAAGFHAQAVSINGKLSQLIKATAEKEHMKGVVEGLKENPRTNIE